jgi:hypothetical protein
MAVPAAATAITAAAIEARIFDLAGTPSPCIRLGRSRKQRRSGRSGDCFPYDRAAHCLFPRDFLHRRLRQGCGGGIVTVGCDKTEHSLRLSGV